MREKMKKGKKESDSLGSPTLFFLLALTDSGSFYTWLLQSSNNSNNNDDGDLT
jgi:hypothetical protein